MDAISDFLSEWGPRILVAVAILIVGMVLIRYAKKGLASILHRNDVEATAAKFVGSVMGAIFWVILLITILAVFGVPTTSFVAVLGAFGLAIGLALQDTISNFASGVLLLVYKPFVAGEYVAAQGVEGTVLEVQIATTTLLSPQNQTVTVPNGQIASDVIVNYTRDGKRRIDLVIGIAYDDDLALAKRVLEERIGSDERVLAEPASLVAVSDLGDSSVDVLARAWVDVDDYWEVVFDWTEQMKLDFDAAGISIPFPQRDVHLLSDSN